MVYLRADESYDGNAWYFPQNLFAIYTIDGKLFKNVKSQHSADEEIPDVVALPFEDQTFDVAFAITVLHHVEPTQWPSCVKELHRVLRPSGLGVVFEHNPFNPLTRLAVHRCEFDEDAVLLTRRQTRRLLTARFHIVDGGYILVTPWDNSVARRLDQTVKSLPFGAQYYVAGCA